MDIQGVLGTDLVAEFPAVYTHAVLKAVPVISFVKTRDSENDVTNLFAVKITNPSSSEESITLKQFDFTFTATPANTVKVRYGADRANFVNDGTASVILAPGETETFYFEATTPLDK
jgi:hypothetical protein